MSQITKYFAGGNTADGFVSFFPFVLPEEKRKRMYYIKGGPGVGKSSFMKVIGSQMEQEGYDVEYFYCSGDPESLDAVTIPALGVGIMDATAPHSYDPVLPGARDTLISLGDYLDEQAMAPYTPELARINAHIGRCYHNCYHYLKSAAILKSVAENVSEDLSLIREKILISGYVEDLLKQHIYLEKPCAIEEQMIGTERELLCSAYTHLGYINLIDSLPCNRVVLIQEHNEQKMDLILRELRVQLLKHGKHVTTLHDPLRPTLLQHLYCKKDQLLFTGDDSLKASAYLCESYRSTGSLYEYTLQDRNYDELIEYAIHQMKSAKKAHDELETYYVKHMDFDGVAEKLNDILTNIKLQKES